nr:unnamed protein product [Spirometra erinaceieuropaei]
MSVVRDPMGFCYSQDRAKTIPSFSCLLNDNVHVYEKFESMSALNSSIIMSSNLNASKTDLKYLFSNRTNYLWGDSLNIYGENGVRDVLRMPRATVSDACDEFSEVRFLRPSTVSCRRVISNASVTSAATIACADLVGIPGRPVNAGGQGAFVLASSPVLEASNMSVNITPEVSCLDGTNGSLISCPAFRPASSSADSFVCVNVPTEITFFSSICSMSSRFRPVDVEIIYQRTGGISNVKITAIIQSVPNIFDQKFSVRFSQVSGNISEEAADTPRSGNPGYNIGAPVLAGTTNYTTVGLQEPDLTTVETILPTSDGLSLASEFGVWSIPVGGVCSILNGNTPDATRFQPISFGLDVYTGCLLSVNKTFFDNIPGGGVSHSEQCSLLQQYVITFLTTAVGFPGKSPLPDRVAIWPAAQTNVSSDWVHVFGIDAIQSPAPAAANGIGCSEFVLGQTITFQYAKFGSLANPVRRIVGVSYSLVRGTLLLDGLERDYEISTRIRFLDVSPSPSVIEMEPPLLVLRLPEDFFYPFFVTT